MTEAIVTGLVLATDPRHHRHQVLAQWRIPSRYKDTLKVYAVSRSRRASGGSENRWCSRRRGVRGVVVLGAAGEGSPRPTRAAADRGELRGLVLRGGRGTSGLPADNPWGLPPVTEPDRLIRQLWAPAANYLAGR